MANTPFDGWAGTVLMVTGSVEGRSRGFSTVYGRCANATCDERKSQKKAKGMRGPSWIGCLRVIIFETAKL